MLSRVSNIALRQNYRSQNQTNYCQRPSLKAEQKDSFAFTGIGTGQEKILALRNRYLNIFKRIEDNIAPNASFHKIYDDVSVIRNIPALPPAGVTFLHTRSIIDGKGITLMHNLEVDGDKYPLMMSVQGDSAPSFFCINSEGEILTPPNKDKNSFTPVEDEKYMIFETYLEQMLYSLKRFEE